MRRVVVAGAAILMAIAGLSLTTASAATLEVAAAPGVFLAQESACAPGTNNGVPVIEAATARANSAGVYTWVGISDIPADCHGLPLDVFIHSTTGDLISSGTGTAGAGVTEVAVGSYTGSAVTAVVVRIDGWLFPTTWTAPISAPMSCVGATPAPIGTGDDCTITYTNGTWWGDSGSRMGHISFSVSTPAQNAIVTLDVSRAPFPEWPIRGFNTNGDWVVVPGYSCSEMPYIRLYANPNHGGKSTSVYLNYWENPGSGSIC